MEQHIGEPEGEPQLDEHAEIEVRQHKLPEGHISTKWQMLEQILGRVSTEQAQQSDWS